jgi:hypothetical protein
VNEYPSTPEEEDAANKRHAATVALEKNMVFQWTTSYLVWFGRLCWSCGCKNCRMVCSVLI